MRETVKTFNMCQSPSQKQCIPTPMNPRVTWKIPKKLLCTFQAGFQLVWNQLAYNLF